LWFFKDESLDTPLGGLREGIIFSVVWIDMIDFVFVTTVIQEAIQGGENEGGRTDCSQRNLRIANQTRYGV